MRTRLASLFVSIALLLLSGTARANSISIIWQATGTDSIFAHASATLTADIVVTISGEGDPAFLVWSVAFDGEVDQLFATGSCGSDLCSFTPVGGGTNWEDITILGQGPDGDAPNPGPSHESSWGLAGDSPNAPLSIGTATVGTITFHVNAATNDGVDVIAGFLNTPAGDQCSDPTTFGACEGNVTFHGASINVPQPGTLALVVVGLAGLGAVARSRRSA